jgi:hypothetical protein
VAKVVTSRAGGTISQVGCGTSVACHGRPLKKKKKHYLCLYVCKNMARATIRKVAGSIPDGVIGIFH